MKGRYVLPAAVQQWSVVPRRAWNLTLAIALFGVAATPTRGDDGAPRGTCDPVDADCSASIDLADADAFVSVLLGETPCSPCAGDANDDGVTDGADVQFFIDGLVNTMPSGACCDAVGICTETTSAGCAGEWLGAGTLCATSACTTGTLTAYRPRHGAGYFPFSRTAVADADKTDPDRGPGIRLNAAGNVDPAGEDDLIELVATVNPPGALVALRRGDPAIRVWLTPDKQPETDIAFDGDVTDVLPIDSGLTTLTLYVEWASAAHGLADLQLESSDGAVVFDVVTFHTFHSIVMALGGEGQSPSVPVDSNSGTFVVGIALYEQGYDVHMYDEDNVSSDGSGSVFNEVVDAVSHRGVDRVAIFGYSHGGGSTYDLADRLDAQRAGIGTFEIEFTSYADAVGNSSDIDISQETRRPPSTGLHANHYQHGTLFELFLDGGPVTNSIPPPTGLDVETTPWGANSTHYTIDDYVQVRSFIEANLIGAMLP
ncbi:MAG: hypothetical protein H6819_04060 [Phycisphaerales bacterium]|nr:hypothetical protein [Phycisphaerales bacterium]MCB9856373.1 hypothetical protein [Phycisphaerales bacterium]MCB9864045.1 hypothetical protein [Phycisphaerales bacterium]